MAATPLYPFAKMTGKDDPTISCTHLMVKLSVLAGRKIILNPKRAGLFGPISQRGRPPDLGNRLTKHQVCGTSG